MVSQAYNLYETKLKTEVIDRLQTIFRCLSTRSIVIFMS